MNEQTVQQRLCSVEGCGRKHTARGFCQMHYKKFKGDGYPPKKRQCGVDGCDDIYYGKGWCRIHYVRWKKYSNPLINNNHYLSFERPEELKEYLLKFRQITALGCWEWTRCIISNGYGRMLIDHMPQSTHRVSAYLWLGLDLESGLFVCHHCDNRSCFNPEHLFLGTQSDNIRDMDKKGRRFNRNNNLHLPRSRF